MKLKVEFIDGSVKVIKVEHVLIDLNPVFNDLYYQFNNFENKGKCGIEEISRVTVDNEVIYDHMGRKENYKRRNKMKTKVIEFISLQELAKYLGVEIYYDESKFKPYTVREKENN